MIDPLFFRQAMLCPACGAGLSWGYTTELDKESGHEHCTACGAVLGDWHARAGAAARK